MVVVVAAVAAVAVAVAVVNKRINKHLSFQDCSTAGRTIIILFPFT